MTPAILPSDIVAPQDVWDFVVNAATGKLTQSQVQDIKNQTATNVRNAGGSVVDAQQSAQEIDNVVNLNGGTASVTDIFTSAGLTQLSKTTQGIGILLIGAALVIGIGYFILSKETK